MYWNRLPVVLPDRPHPPSMPNCAIASHRVARVERRRHPAGVESDADAGAWGHGLSRGPRLPSI